MENAGAVHVPPNSRPTMGPTNCAERIKTMGLNSPTYPLQYEDLRPNTDPEITFDLDRIDEPANAETGFEGIIGRSSGLRRVLQMVETVAWGDSTVLLLGETGTGKELIARAIHSHSPRRDRPLRQTQLCRHPYRAARERTVWARAGIVHRRDRAEDRPARAGTSRFAVPG